MTIWKVDTSLIFTSLLLTIYLLLLIPYAESKLEPSMKVGVYYYVWYDPESANQDMPRNWSYPYIQDKPYLDYYHSQNYTIIEQHFAWFIDLKIDFAIISWWGPNSFTDNITDSIFETMKNNLTNSVKLCIMVEPYNHTYSPYNYTDIYDHIYDNFVIPYKSIYFHQPNRYGILRPLIVFWNDDNLTDPSTMQHDDRFTETISGHKPYAEWIYNYYDGYEPWKTWKNLGYFQIPQCRVYPVSPRYDDVYVRTPNYTVDRDYSQQLYVKQWENAIKFAKNNTIDIVTIATWNEFPERTMIEPHYDRDAFNSDPFYLYNITKQYIAQLKGLPDPITPEKLWYHDPIRFTAVIGVLAMAILVGYEVYKHY